MGDEDDDRQPLKDEAAKREEWRGGETVLNEKDADGHTLPESERDRATAGNRPGQSGTVGGTILPPD